MLWPSLAPLGVARVEVDGIGPEIGEDVRSRSAEPVLEEGLVEEKGRDVCKVGKERGCAVWEATTHQDSLGKPNGKLFCAAVEVWIRGAGRDESGQKSPPGG